MRILTTFMTLGLLMAAVAWLAAGGSRVSAQFGFGSAPTGSQGQGQSVDRAWKRRL